jgi:hypothetical protein
MPSLICAPINAVSSAFTAAEIVAAMTPRHATVEVHAEEVPAVAAVAPVKEVPRAERRAKPPKLSDTAVKAPEPVVEEVVQAAEPIVDEVVEDDGNMFQWKEDGMYHQGEPVLAFPEILEPVDDVHLGMMIESELHLLCKLTTDQFLNKQPFNTPVLTCDGRLLVGAGVPITDQVIRNLIVYREGMVGDPEELAMFVAEMDTAEEEFRSFSEAPVSK